MVCSEPSPVSWKSMLNTSKLKDYLDKLGRINLQLLLKEKELMNQELIHQWRKKVH